MKKTYSHSFVLSVVVAGLSVILGTGCDTLTGEPVLKGRVDIGAGEGPAVIYLKNVPGGLIPETDTVITHLANGSFDPPVSIGFVGNEFVFRNEDDELHTTHLYMHLAYQEEISGRPIENGATLYNFALPKKDMEVRRPIKGYHHFGDETGVIDVRCNPHPNEGAAALVFDHPFVALTDTGGAFEMPNAPPGTHELWVWHKGEAQLWQSVEVKQRGSTEVAVELGAR
jgi:hypothetical protein